MSEWLCSVDEGGTAIFYGKYLGTTPTGHFIVANIPSTSKRVIHANKAKHITFFGSYDAMMDFVLAHDGNSQMVSLAPAEAPPPAPQADFLVTVTGHRPDKLGGYKLPNPMYDLVLKGLYDAFLHFKPSYVITGMSLGIDQWAAELCININIPFLAAIPFQGQDSIWPPQSKAKYQWLLTKAAGKYVINEGGFEGWKMQKRNEWMINRSHQVIAAFNGTPGGTANCLGYAAQVGKPVHYIPLPPAGMEVGEFFQKTYGIEQPKAQPAALPNTGKRVVEI
jgi:uncharacterized phage-like protein YoqJ